MDYDLPDLPLIQQVGLGLWGSTNAVSALHSSTHWIITKHGRTRAVHEICDLIIFFSSQP